MKKQKSILFLLLFLLSLGQNGMGFTGIIPDPSGAEIQPVHQNDVDSYPPASAYLVSTSAQTETILNNPNHPSPQFSESNSNEEEIRNWVKEQKLKRERKEWLSRAETIERSLTFRELIYPHHFYF